jgi:glycosyltransferase involved in cell wall biosynthesis
VRTIKIKKKGDNGQLAVHVSVVIPTYRRGYIIGYLLEALRKQVYQDFEVIVVLRPSGDGTEKVLEQFGKLLKMQVVLRDSPLPITDALNMGIAKARGQIIAFIDDDALPDPQWILRHVKMYENPQIGGVAGEVVSASQLNMEPIVERQSQIIFFYKPALENAGRLLWNRPLSGLENHLLFISRAGTVAYENRLSDLASNKPVMSLLGMGCNMSVRAKAVKSMIFPNDVWVYGLGWEQYMGWWIKKKGYITLFEPKLEVKHYTHESASRNILNTKKQLITQAESDFLFYMLWGSEKQMSIMARISWFIFTSAVDIKRICINKEVRRTPKIAGRFYFELLGIKWLISKRFGGNYAPRIDLIRFNRSIERARTSSARQA